MLTPPMEECRKKERIIATRTKKCLFVDRFSSDHVDHVGGDFADGFLGAVVPPDVATTQAAQHGQQTPVLFQVRQRASGHLRPTQSALVTNKRAACT